MNCVVNPRRGHYRSAVLALVVVLALAAAWKGHEFYVSAWLPYQAEQPIKKRLEQTGVRFLTEGMPGRVVDAFSPHSAIPESCLGDLAELKKLKRIELLRTLTKDGVASLEKMRRLEFLHVYFATDEQLETLRASLPDCKIICEVTPGASVNPAPNPDGPPESD